MTLDSKRVQQYLKNCDFKSLFTQELGWDQHPQKLDVNVDGSAFTLNAVAQKRGMVAFVCAPLDNGRIPDYPSRRKIEQRVTKSVHEHLIIYVDADRTTQTWQWIKREQGKPTACREHTYHRNQSGEALIQKLRNIAFTLKEEEGITIIDVAGRARAGFDVERVTKRFYERFKTEHAAFLKFLKGIPDEEMERWYVSVMLNRLMFIYFIQKKGFLNNDPDYLRNKLAQSKARGKDKFYSDFLCPLFFEGFAKNESERSEAMNKLLGKVPYLNGGIFQRHQIEELHGKSIQIPDSAFEKIFAFFEDYQWHLDERPLRNDKEINPDVLGYIFEKYINQKQMGAYYTKEDITEYISKNTIIPYLFDAARKECKIAFEPACADASAGRGACADASAGRGACADASAGRGDHTVWQLLQADPDRYIYDAVKHGLTVNIHEKPAKALDKPLPLPPEIAAGINDVSKRTHWNKSAPPEYALPTEIWREVVARRKRYEEVRSKLANGEVHDINDLITYNLNIRQFARDVIENCEGPELLRAFWHSIQKVTILDPTCGSGAFLFAALNILDDLYEACLDRMEVFIEELDKSGKKHRPEKYSDFRKVLERIESHRNRRYFVLKSIIVNNLYGVDIMEEAVEICKLRLFLKLVAQIEPTERVEPLPDIDFNIRAGNILVGYASYDRLKAAAGNELDFDNTMRKIEIRAADLQQAFDTFRKRQLEGDGSVPAEDKDEVRLRLDALKKDLNQYLAKEYGAGQKGKMAFEQWIESHKPLHWFIEFYRIIKEGGFDAVIGNPPYLEIRQVDYSPRHFECLDSGAIHAMCIEQSLRILSPLGCMSMIVPLSLVSTQRMARVQRLLESVRNVWFCNYSWRPGKLFDTVNRALTIFVITPSKNGRTFSTGYQKWNSDSRDLLMHRCAFADASRERPAFWVPKISASVERNLLAKFLNVKGVLGHLLASTGNRVYYRTTGGLYWKVFTDFSPRFKVNGRLAHSTRETWIAASRAELIKPIIALLSSDLFWWWYTVTSNCRDLNPYDIHNFPVAESALKDARLSKLGQKYLNDLIENSATMVRLQKQTGRTETQSFKIQKSKSIINEIDRVLAEHYGFTDEELDFIINYDIKYRMGAEAEKEE